MTASGSLWRLVERLTAFLPSPPADREHPSSVPDPQEPGISTDERVARWRLWRHGKEKAGKGGYR
jgi:hypothetical protein